MVNTLFNTSSGRIEVGEYAFTGHNVSILTGTHDYRLIGEERLSVFPKEGNDIIIGKGVWIASNAIVLGPCKIGDNAVVAAGSLVKGDVPSGAIVAGIPAKPIGFLENASETGGL
ncbi:MAG: acyltransferase [Gammaproteobacteria bacterium]|nr:MAG: acyltransferase [Gammaproteobacteria bacterium]